MKFYRCLLGLVALHLVACNSNYRQVEIRGDINAAAGSMAYATTCIEQTYTVVDSCEVGLNGRFLLKLAIDDCELVQVSFSKPLKPVALIVNPGNEIVITQNADSYSVDGSFESMQLQQIQQQFTKYNQEILNVSKYLTDSTLLADRLVVDARVDSVVACAQRVAIRFVEDNPYSLTSMMLLNMQLDSVTRFLPYAQFRSYYKHVDSCLRSVYLNNYAVKQFASNVRKLEVRYNAKQTTVNHGVGDKIPSLSFQLINGEKLELPNYYSRLLIVDFIADWEGQYSITDYYDVFEKYNRRGLHIVQIVSSTDTAKCKKMMLNDSIPWNCMVIGNPNTSSIIKTLGIMEFPCNFVIDRRGRIVAKNIYNEELMSLLERRFTVVVKPKVDTVRRRVVEPMELQPLKPMLVN